MKIFGIDADKATVANSVALLVVCAYIVFIGVQLPVPTGFVDVVKTAVAFLFLSKAYEANNK